MIAQDKTSQVPSRNPDEFDAYYQWLGIPPEEQPANHYRLLGIKVFEANADVIDMAAERQMRHVRSFQAGKHSRESQQLLNELARARVSLLNEKTKAAYDAELRQQIDQQESASESTNAPTPAPPVIVTSGPPRHHRSQSTAVSNRKKPNADRWAEIAGSWPVVQAALRNRRTTAIVLGITAAFALIAAVVLIFRTPMGEMEVVLDEGVADSVQVTLTRGGKEFTVSLADQWSIRLAEGEYHVDVKGGTQQFDIRDKTIMVSRGSKAIVRVSVRDSGTPLFLESNRAPPMARAPFDAKLAKRYQQAWARHLSVPVQFTNSIGMQFVLIPPGKFLMGSPNSEELRESQWETQYEVTISRAFYLCTTEVTQACWTELMDENPSGHQGDTELPVEQVSWEDCSEFLDRLNRLSAEPNRRYRFPTEAEWEYACRAGTQARHCGGDDPRKIKQYAWCEENTSTTQPVGTRMGNAWNAYDMHGNVWEHCSDRIQTHAYGDYAATSPVDPTGSTSGSRRIARGGSFEDGCMLIRSARRGSTEPSEKVDHVGLRVACEIGQ